ncbi:MAG: selenium cofactor biosynthesis protein YqeC [Eubacteriales bacterium]|nr:selenium cofactor biosynthesis protein YqeC [Eubacteriales bacterium]
MKLFETLGIAGMRSVAVCGAGGKTTVLYALAEEARRQNQRVLVTTSTHILQPENTERLHFYEEQQLDTVESICIPGQISVIGTPCGDKKITGLNPMTLDDATKAADVVLYEADGSKRLPVKCHKDTEPVIWFGTEAVICVLGLSALGQSAHSTCHRWQLDPLFSLQPQKRLDADDFIRLALECRQKAGYPHIFVVCLNQCDNTALRWQAQCIAAGLSIHGIACTASCFSAETPEIAAL